MSVFNISTALNILEKKTIILNVRFCELHIVRRSYRTKITEKPSSKCSPSSRQLVKPADNMKKKFSVTIHCASKG